jgi:hypothetical protein
MTWTKHPPSFVQPQAHAFYSAEPDDSFLKAMVSDKQLENIKHTEQVVKENEMLKSFKASWDVPCEMCREPVKRWLDYFCPKALRNV